MLGRGDPGPLALPHVVGATKEGQGATATNLIRRTSQGCKTAMTSQYQTFFCQLQLASQDALEVMFVTDQPLVDWTDVTLDASEWRVRKPTGDFTDVALTSEDTVIDTEIVNYG